MRTLTFAALCSAFLFTSAGCKPAGPALPAAGPNAVEMEVTSKPEGATVVVDGSALGKTPVKVKLNPGPHRARASMSGYYPPPEARFQVGAGEPTTITIPLMASH